MTDRARLQMLEERAVLWAAVRDVVEPPGEGRCREARSKRRGMKPAELRDLKRLRRKLGARWDPATSTWHPFVERLADRRVR